MNATRVAGAIVAAGALLALAVVPAASAPLACESEVTFGVFVARSACFEATDTVYSSATAVRINGIDLTPDPGARISIDTATGTVSSTGATLSARAGPLGTITLWHGAVSWAVPGGTVPLTVVKFDLGPLASLAGIQLRGEVSLVLTGPGAAEISVYASLPDPIGVSGNLKLKFDMDRGLYLDSLRIDLKEAFIGTLQINDAYFTYNSAGNEFTGGGLLSFPSAGSLQIDLVVRESQLTKLHADYNAPPPGLALGGSVYFRRAVFDYRSLTKSMKYPLLGSFPAGPLLSGRLTLTAGGEVNGKPLATIVGSLVYSPVQPWRLGVAGDLSIAGVPTASAYLKYLSTGGITFGGTAKGVFLDVVQVEGAVRAWYEDKSHWSGEGSVKVCVWKGCGSGEIVVSNVGIAGCIHAWLADFGVGTRWGARPTFYLAGCSIGSYRGTRRRLASYRHEEVRASRNLELEAGLPFAVFRAEGSNRVPKAIVSGPDGKRIVGSADPDAYVSNREDGYIIWNIGPENASYVIVKDPAPGIWAIDVDDNSAGLVDADVAEGYDPPRVTGDVDRDGEGFVLRYETDLPEGATVRFEEQGPLVWNDLGVVRGDREGLLRFRPADGPGGRRTIFALVSRDGLPDARFPVTDYVAPKPPPPGEPEFVRAERGNGNVVITWGDAQRASGYAVYVLFANGVRHELAEPAGSRRVVIPEADDESSVLVTVIGYDDDEDRGEPVRFSLPGRAP